jgi:hypothetical protein
VFWEKSIHAQLLNVAELKNWEFFIEIYFFCVSKISIDLFFKLPVNRYLAINIEGKIGQLTVRRTSSFIRLAQSQKIGKPNKFKICGSKKFNGLNQCS